MLFLVLAAITAGLCVLPLLVMRKWSYAVSLFTVGVISYVAYYYAATPSLVGPFWGTAGALIALSWIITGATQFRPITKRIVGFYRDWDHPDRLKFDKDPSEKELFRSRVAIAIVLIVPMLFIGRAAFGCAIARSSDYSAMIGNVEQRTWTQDVQPKDPKHIRLVPIEMAQWLANKQLGEAPGAIGSQFQVDNDRMTLQMIHGELWYVAPLEFQGFSVWYSADVSPGYVMVSGEDPNRPVIVKSDERFAYMPGAYFGKDLERHLWTNGYANKGLSDFTFEIDEAGKAWWVVTVFEPTIAWSGERVLGVAVVDPTDGSQTYYPLGSVPQWVDRVMPQAFVTNYITWRGMYAGGWWNSVWAKKNMTKPQTPAIIHGSDNEPYWVSDITSTNDKDSSLVGLMYTNSRTGKSVYYRAVGGTDDAVLKAVDNKVAYRKWHGASPALYNIYGVMSSIVPLLGENHTFQGVAIVRIDNLGTVGIGTDETSAMADYAKLLGIAPKATPPTFKHSSTGSHGTVDRIAPVTKGGETMYYLHLIESDIDPRMETKLYTGSNELSPKLALTKPGDRVFVTYIDIETSGDVMPLFAFENLSLPLTMPPPPRPKTAK